jgi:hypothetical protein
MGNHLSMDIDEEYMKGMLWSPTPLDIIAHFQDNPIFVVREFVISKDYFYFLRIAISDYMGKEATRDYMRTWLVKHAMRDGLGIDLAQQTDVDMHITGNGIQMHKALIQYISEQRLGLVNPILNKHRSIDRIYAALNYLMDVKYKFLYEIIEPPGVGFTKITDLTPFTKNHLDFANGDSLEYPLLLMNMKSGVSYYKIREKGGPLEKIMGSILGESTMSGMCKLFGMNTENRASESIKDSYRLGCSTKVDLTVGDIYGEAVAGLGLDADLLASSFGKPAPEAEAKVNVYDTYNSMATMFTVNSSNIAALISKIHNIRTIIVLPSQFDYEP